MSILHGHFLCYPEELEREFEEQLGGAANGPPRPLLESPLLRLACRGCKNLTHTRKSRQVQRTQMVATARFTILVLVTFSDCYYHRTQRNRRSKGCEI